MRHPVLKQALPIAFMALTVLAAVYLVYAYWDDLGPLLAEMNPALGVLGVLLAAAGTFLNFVMWRQILAGMGAVFGWRVAAQVFFVSQTGKYLPGSVWPILAQMEFGRRTGTPKRTMLAANILTMALSVVVGMILAAATLPWVSSDAIGQYWYAFAALPFMAVALHPRVIPGILNWLFRKLGREPLGLSLTWSGVGVAVLWALGAWVLLGLSLYSLTAALGVAGGAVFWACIGGLAMAVGVGLLFVIAPAGAGVRDAVLIASLGTVTSAPIAVAAGLLSRMSLVLVDFALAGIFGFRRRTLAPADGTADDRSAVATTDPALGGDTPTR